MTQEMSFFTNNGYPATIRPGDVAIQSLIIGLRHSQIGIAVPRFPSQRPRESVIASKQLDPKPFQFGIDLFS